MNEGGTVVSSLLIFCSVKGDEMLERSRSRAPKPRPAVRHGSRM